MKKVLLGLLISGILALVPSVQAQTDAPAPIEYSERVPAEGAGKTALYHRALEWTQNKFAYGPKSGFKAEEGVGTVRVTGTGKAKKLDAKGKDQEITVLFDFVFRANDNGYEYSVGSFRVVPDPAQPAQVVSFDDYRTELRADKSNSRTNNDRRLTAQVTSLASEAAMAFRSHMNSAPTDDHVGVVGSEN